MTTRIESGRLPITKGAAFNDLVLKVVTAFLITFAVAIVLIRAENHLVGPQALDLLNAEYHSAEFF